MRINDGNGMKRFALLALLTLCWPALSQAQPSEIHASVDRTRISTDETLVLSVRVSPPTGAQPDFSLLSKDFEVLDTASNSVYLNNNGQVQSYTQWQLTLAPRQAGKLVIPSFQYQDQYSDALVIEVQPAQFSSGQRPDTFLELTADLETPYVQQQVLLTIKLYTAVPLRIEDAPALDLPQTLLVHLGNNQYQKRLGGKAYTVSELRYALFPQQSGELVIPAQRYTISQGNRFSWNQPQQLKRVTSNALTLRVQPQPQQFTGRHWLPADSLQLTEQWSSEQWMVGEPVTRTLLLSGNKISAAQLPAFELAPPPDFKLYPEPGRTDEQKTTEGLTSQLSQTLALVPTRAGELTLPAVQLHWWNTQLQRQETLSLPERTIVVAENPGLARAPAEPAGVPVQAAATDNSAGFWPWLALALGLSNLVCLGLLWRGRTTDRPGHAAPASPPADRPSLAALRQLCQQPLTPASARAILTWLSRWCLVEQGLRAEVYLARHPGELAAQYQALEAFVYGQHTGYDGDLSQLASLVRQAPRAGTGTGAADQPSLPPLYPTHAH